MAAARARKERRSRKPIAAEPAPERKLGRIAFKPCTLSPPMGAQSLEAQCGTLSVPENPAQPKGRQIALHVAWIPADESGNHDPDPVFLIAGGPGQSATESFAGMIPTFRDVTQEPRHPPGRPARHGQVESVAVQVRR